MPNYAFRVVNVFAEAPFGGNPLAVVLDAQGLSTDRMQAIAAEFNYAETTFVLPPTDPANSAQVRIFNRTAEMPFAGHPNVGTGYVLAGLGRDTGGVLRFEEIAGLVEVRVTRNAAGQLVGAVIDAPRPLALGPELTAAQVAACLGIDAAGVVTTAHPPVQASVGVDFFFAQVTPEALGRAGPDLAGFRQVQAETDAGKRPGSTSEQLDEVKRLRRENAELRRANDILKAAASFFGAELDRHSKR